MKTATLRARFEPEIAFTTYDDVRAALHNPDLSRSISLAHEAGNILENVVMVLDREQHRDRRRVESAAFRPETLIEIERRIFPGLIHKTLAELTAGETADLVELGGVLTVGLSARNAGIDLVNGGYEEKRHLVHYLDVIARGVSIDAATRRVEVVKAEVQQALAGFRTDYFEPSVARRREAPVSDRSDVLTMLLLAQAELKLSDEDIMRETAFFLEAGSHSSAQTLTNTTHFLLEYSKIHPDAWHMVAESRLFAQRCVHESVRLRPTNTMIKRRALRDTNVGSTPVISGALIGLDIVAANSDVDVYGERAAEFDPLRVVPPSAARYGHSFGAGVHACIGRTLAIGLPIRDDREFAEGHLFGMVPLMLSVLAARGIEPAPTASVPETGTRRWTRWHSYPIKLRRR